MQDAFCPLELTKDRKIIANSHRRGLTPPGFACNDRVKKRLARSSLHYNCRMRPVHASALLPVLHARYKKLFGFAQQLPPVGSRPLTVDGKVTGWVTARATSCLAGQPGVVVDQEAVHMRPAPHRHMALNDVLANVAEVLQRAGCLRTWRNELLDVYGEGRCLGVIERAAMRPLGMLTKAVHLNAWTPEGRLWIARRADTKATDPGMWDTLVGGLAGSGETLDHSLLRESNEEAGLAPEHIAERSPLRLITRMHRRLPEGYQVEDLLVSDCVLAPSVAPRNMDGEVSEIRHVDIQELMDLIQAEQVTLEAELVILEGLQRKLEFAGDR